jgi:dTDP-glucose 4,6-dehydratase
MGETASIIADIMGVDIEIITDPQRLRPGKSEVERLWADTSKAQRLLNHIPNYAGLDGLRRGLTDTVEWFLRNENLKAYKSHIYNI